MNDQDGRVDDELREAGAEWRSKRATPDNPLNPALFTATSRRPSAGRRALASFAGVLAVVVVGLVVVVSLPLRDQRVATASQSPQASTDGSAVTASPSPSPSLVATSTNSTDVDGITWKHITFDQPLPADARLASVQTINGRFFMYALRCEVTNPVCASKKKTYYPFVSDNGETWTAFAPLTISADVVRFSYDAALGYVATADFYDGPGAGLWHSTDGRSWEWLGDKPGLGDGVCAGRTIQAINASTFYRSDNGLIISGLSYCANSFPEEGAWTSADGQNWAATDVPPVEDVLERDGRWIGIGTKGIWMSDNGRDWSQAEAIQSAAQLLEVSTGLLVLSSSDNNLTHSMSVLPDAGTWRGPLDMFHGSALDAFSTDGTRAVVMEPTPNPNGPTAVWVSSVDGMSWSRHAMPPEVSIREFLSLQRYQTTATLGDRVVALPNDNSLWVADIATPDLTPAATNSPNPTPTSLPATPSPNPTPTPTSRPTLAPDAVGWVRQSDPGFGSVDSFSSSATNGGVTVVTGGLELEPNTKAVVSYRTTWRTADGYNWQPSTFWPELQDRHYEYLGVSAYESGFVVYAVYSDGATGTEWTDVYLSADGDHWQLVGHIDGYGVTAVVAIGGRLSQLRPLTTRRQPGRSCSRMTVPRGSSPPRTWQLGRPHWRRTARPLT